MYDEIRELLNKYSGASAERIIISNPVAGASEYRRIDIRRVKVRGKGLCQVSKYTQKQVFQENISDIMLTKCIMEYFPGQFCQLSIIGEEGQVDMKVTKKGKLLKNITKKNVIKKDDIIIEETHNRKKNYLIEEGVVVPALVDLGVITKEGKVVNRMYDKFKQINRFLEIIDDVIDGYGEEEINVIDFGCGKSYLTFVVYYYLTEIKKKKANVTGLDLKKEVIEKCNRAADKYGYNGLHFELGDINGYKTDKRVDMVITLHACDTATDYALYNAVTWNARYIFSVPCCQHELNKQIQSKVLAPIMNYGIIKERFSSLATDSLRGCMLEYKGYKTQLLEFVDIENSPKNILIRAVKTNVSREKRERSLTQAKDMCVFLGASPTIMGLLGEE